MCPSENMAVAPTLAIAGGIIDSFKASKLKKAEAGTKTFTKPKTLVGKLIGGVSGRTAASQYQQNSNSDPMIIQSAKSAYNTGNVPVTGGISFGGEAAKKTWLPFAVVAAVVAIIVFGRKKRTRRR